MTRPNGFAALRAMSEVTLCVIRSGLEPGDGRQYRYGETLIVGGEQAAMLILHGACEIEGAE